MLGKPLARSKAVGRAAGVVGTLLDAEAVTLLLHPIVPSSPSTRKLFFTVRVPMSRTKMSEVLELCGTKITGAPASISKLILDPLKACSAI